MHWSDIIPRATLTIFFSSCYLRQGNARFLFSGLPFALAVDTVIAKRAESSGSVDRGRLVFTSLGELFPVGVGGGGGVGGRTTG